LRRKRQTNPERNRVIESETSPDLTEMQCREAKIAASARAPPKAFIR
jgi:hypothetical protein